MQQAGIDITSKYGKKSWYWILWLWDCTLEQATMTTSHIINRSSLTNIIYLILRHVGEWEASLMHHGTKMT